MYTHQTLLQLYLDWIPSDVSVILLFPCPLSFAE